MNRISTRDESPSGSAMDSVGYTEDMDPSLYNGFRLLYEREVPCEVRNQLGDNTHMRQQGSLELVRFKIVLNGPDDSPAAVRLELCSEADLFFHYTHILDESNFQKVQEQQKLMVELADYPTILVRMLNACIKEPHIHLAIFTIQNDAEARLDFIQNMEYKFVELMYCCCLRSPDDITQQQIAFRYNSVKQKLAVAQNKLVEIHNLVKIKNPSLLLNIQKVTGTGAVSTSATSLAAAAAGLQSISGAATAANGAPQLLHSSSGSSGMVHRVSSTNGNNNSSSTVFQKGFR